MVLRVALRSYTACLTQIKNYDDINEYFWTKECMEQNYEQVTSALKSTFHVRVPLDYSWAARDFLVLGQCCRAQKDLH